MAPGTGGCKSDKEGSVRANLLVKLVQNRRNREITRYLLDNTSTSVHLATLVQFIERQEPTDNTECEDQQRERIAADLHHCRLPQLSDAQVIEYDPRSHTVVCQPSQQVECEYRELLAMADQFQQE